MKNYLPEMLYTLTSAYSRKDYDNCQMNRPLETNIGKLFSIFAWGLDSVREQIDLIKLWDNIDNACGNVLDRYGANFGIKRINSDDRYYRLAIKVKVMAQLSGGDIDTVIWAAASLLEVEPEDVSLEEIYPAQIALYVNQHIISPEHLEMIFLIAKSIKRIMAAGIGMRLYLCTHRSYRYKLPVKWLTDTKSHIVGTPSSQKRINRLYMSISHGTGICAIYYNVRLRYKRID